MHGTTDDFIIFMNEIESYSLQTEKMQRDINETLALLQTLSPSSKMKFRVAVVKCFQIITGRASTNVKRSLKAL